MKYISLSVRWRWLTVCMNDNCHGGERTGNSSLQAGPPTPSRSQRTSLTTTTDIEHFSHQYFISYASPSCREPKLCLWFILLHPADLVSAGEFLQAFRDDCSASHTAGTQWRIRDSHVSNTHPCQRHRRGRRSWGLSCPAWTSGSCLDSGRGCSVSPWRPPRWTVNIGQRWDSAPV